MKRALKVVILAVLLAVTAYADDTVKEFSFKTVDGKTVEYRASGGSAMVVNIGSHW